MSKIGQQFSEMRKSTPKYIQWVLLAAAIIIVVILILLLVGGRMRPVSVPEDVAPTMPEIVLEPSDMLDWTDTPVGETRTQKITVRANMAVQITDVDLAIVGDADVPDISEKNTCANENTVVDENTNCEITIEFKPTDVIPVTTVNLAVAGKTISDDKDFDSDEMIIIRISSVQSATTNEPEVKKPLTIEETPEFVEDDMDNDVAEQLQKGINTIAPPIDFPEEDEEDYKMPEYNPNAPAQPVRSAFASPCSEFSFPGYNTAGVQSGWIRPRGGAYYYHPFSDTNCNSPTGVYNADTGYIMDINNPTRKIGSDAEHVRLAFNDIGLKSRAERTGTSTRTTQLDIASLKKEMGQATATNEDLWDEKSKGVHRVKLKPSKIDEKTFQGSGAGDAVYSSIPFDRTFVLRQYKPIPATIVSDVQADPKILGNGLPVRATVDRNVYSDDGRTVIIPTGTLMLGYVTGNLPGPYKAVGRMEINWYQFIRPDGVEFNFPTGNQPFGADSQGRKGVPGHGSTDYLQQFVLPMLTAIVPAAVNMIAPISDSFVNQIDLDNNTVVQTGKVRSSELAKNEIITAWNNVATKLLVDVMENTVPPFSIAAGTRITVFSPVDIIVSCGEAGSGKKCALTPKKEDVQPNVRTGKAPKDYKLSNDGEGEEWIGQVRSMVTNEFFAKKWCTQPSDDKPVSYANETMRKEIIDAGYTFETVDFYCRSFNTYQAINNAKQQAVYQNQLATGTPKSDGNPTSDATKNYNTQVLGLKYDENNKIVNPFSGTTKKPETAAAAEANVLTCEGGAAPDANGCCPGETYTDMGAQGMNCCPDAGGDCFPPITM